MSKNGKTGNNRDNLDDGPRESEFVKRMIKDVKQVPTDTTILYGYVGTSETAEVTRLYTDISFRQYYEINKSDIKDWKENTEDKDPFGGTYLFVNSDAEIKVVEIQVTKVRARFLAGDISKNIKPSRMQIARRKETPLRYEMAAASTYCTDDSCDYTCAHTRCVTCGDSCPPCGEPPTPTWGYTCVTRPSCRQTCEGTCFRTCYETCKDTCGGYTCEGTCEGNTCEYTCNTCEGYTCEGTCEGNTCEGSCNYTCQDTCRGYSCDDPCPIEENRQMRLNPSRRNPKSLKTSRRRYRKT